MTAHEDLRDALAALRSDNRTGYKGVTAQDGRYRAQIAHDGRKVHLGLYATPEDAARAYDVAALELYGPDAWTNHDHGRGPAPDESAGRGVRP